jgi:hypothetical protein
MKASNDGHMGRAVSSFAEPADSECEAPCVPLASSGDAHPTAAELEQELRIAADGHTYTETVQHLVRTRLSRVVGLITRHPNATASAWRS